MVFIPNSFGQATLVFSTPGPSGPAMMTFGFDGNPSDPDGDATLIQASWAAAGTLRFQQDSNTVLNEVRVLERTVGGELVAGLNTTTAAGGASGTGASPQVAALIQKLTGLAGRNRRGRFYMPGALAVGETGQWNASTLTNLQNAADAFLAELTSRSIIMHLLHVDPADTPIGITELRAAAIVGTQRRRLR